MDQVFEFFLAYISEWKLIGGLLLVVTQAHFEFKWDLTIAQAPRLQIFSARRHSSSR